MARDTVAHKHEDYAYEDEQGENPGVRLLREVLEVAVITLLLFICVRGVIQNYQVQGPSMMPTLQNNQYILVDKATYLVSAPHRGDVIVFKWPKDPSEDFVKRIIGVPGDTVHIDTNGRVTVDGVPITEPYVNDLTNPYEVNQPNTWVIGPDEYFVLGDNRGNSSDSRSWGLVPRSDIIGRAELVYWPLDNIHVLSDWSNVFAGIHG